MLRATEQSAPCPSHGVYGHHVGSAQRGEFTRVVSQADLRNALWLSTDKETSCLYLESLGGLCFKSFYTVCQMELIQYLLLSIVQVHR